MANTINSMIHFVVIPVMAKRSFRKILQNRSPAIHPVRIAVLNIFIGALILYRIINPTIASSIVAAVEISVSPTPKEMTFNDILIRFQCKEESRDTDRKHTDQGNLRWLQWIREHKYN